MIIISELNDRAILIAVLSCAFDLTLTSTGTNIFSRSFIIILICRGYYFHNSYGIYSFLSSGTFLSWVSFLENTFAVKNPMKNEMAIIMISGISKPKNRNLTCVL
jgi:hypothetical protein